MVSEFFENIVFDIITISMKGAKFASSELLSAYGSM
jgi:hypothetical protein